MRIKRHRSATSQVVVGVAAIVIGAMFLLDNLDVFEFRHYISFWPMVLVVLMLRRRDVPSNA